jgi:hypothetical protein
LGELFLFGRRGVEYVVLDIEEAAQGGGWGGGGRWAFEGAVGLRGGGECGF